MSGVDVRLGPMSYPHTKRNACVGDIPPGDRQHYAGSVVGAKGNVWSWSVSFRWTRIVALSPAALPGLGVAPSSPPLHAMEAVLSSAVRAYARKRRLASLARRRLPRVVLRGSCGPAGCDVAGSSQQSDLLRRGGPHGLRGRPAVLAWLRSFLSSDSTLDSEGRDPNGGLSLPDGPSDALDISDCETHRRSILSLPTMPYPVLSYHSLKTQLSLLSPDRTRCRSPFFRRAASDGAKPEAGCRCAAVSFRLHPDYERANLHTHTRT